MPSVLIKGMKMPKQNEELCIRIYPSGKVAVDLDLHCKQVAEAIEIPDHGDLIDKDSLVEMCDAPHWCVWLSEIEDAPVVIPAERSEDGEA